jgi:putative oxidoreductase
MSDVMDRVSAAGHDAVLLVARLAMAAIFLPSGFQKLTHLATFAQSLSQRGVPGAAELAPLAAGVEFLGALLILLGIRLRWAALLMAVFTAVAALVSHRFWELADAERTQQQVQFMKNVAIIGGFLALFVAGPGRYAVEHWIGGRLMPRHRWQ